MKTAPKEIYLQWNPDKEEDVEFITEGTSWCEDKINDNDLRYIRDKEIVDKIEKLTELYQDHYSVRKALSELKQYIKEQR